MIAWAFFVREAHGQIIGTRRTRQIHFFLTGYPVFPGRSGWQSGASMKRTYNYKGYEVTVELEPVWEAVGGVTLLPPRGFVAVVHIRAAGAVRPMVGPIRLTADSQHPFATEAEALMAGYSAGQRVVDDTLVP
jgi:hypothetical protein